MIRTIRNIPPLAARLAEGRPVLTKEQITGLTKRVMAMTAGDEVMVSVAHTARVISRMANDQILSGDDGDELTIGVWSRFGEKSNINVRINQLDDTALRAMIERSEAIAREKLGSAEAIFPHPQQTQDTFVPAQLWHDETIHAMTTTRGTVVPELLSAVARAQLRAAGFVGLMARAESFLSKQGILAYSEETDSEVTITARGQDGKSSGWDGQAARNWSMMRPTDVAARAIDFATRSANPVAVEPGRRTAILGPAAVVQVIRFLAEQFDAQATDDGATGFSRRPRGNKRGQRVFDPRLNMRSDPADPEGGYRPYFAEGHATPAMSWVENGVLKNLAYGPRYAMMRGKAYAAMPYSIRLSGGTTSIEQMIAQCQEGIYVNRFSAVDLVDPRTGLTTGVTRDGCFLIKNGKIDRSIKNFRFLESPFFFLNNIEALGAPERATFGYTPKSFYEMGPADWPRLPIIVPPMMVRDFNFSSLSDAI